MIRLKKAALAAGLLLSAAIAAAGVTSYSTTPANNNAAPPNGAPEGMSAGSVNNVIRQIMTDIAIEAQKNQVKTLSSVSGTNTITASMSPALTSYTAGTIAVLIPANSSTGAVTLAVNGLTALDVQKYDGDALSSGDLVAGVPAVIVLDSGADDWILLNPQTNDVSAATILSRLLTVDGSGSGLDADLLDGNNSSAFVLASGIGSTVPSPTGTGASGTWGISISGNAATATNGLTTSNYTSYAPTLTGGGASGTWGISISGNAATSTSATNATNANKLLINGDYRVFNWSGQVGMPFYVWGSNDGENFYPWSPENFSVYYATSAGNADTVDGQHASAFAAASHTHTSSQITDLPTLASGTCTPTVTTISGGGSVSGASCQYMRVGSTVTYSGGFSSSASGSVRFGITIPVSSNFTAATDLGGFIYPTDFYPGSTSNGAGMDADATNDRANQAEAFGSVTASTHTYTFHATYRVQ